MRTVHRAYVDIAEGQIHVHHVEGREPPILFLHQTASSARSYDPLLKAMALPNRLIAPDTPGFGGSYDPEGWPALETYAGQILAAADALGVDRFHLYGHHTGASLGIEIAARAPDRVISLMLSGPVFMTTDERDAFVAAYRDPITPQRDGSHLARNWTYAASNNPSCDADILQDAVTDLLRAWRGRPQAYMAVAHHDTEARAREVRAPALLLTTKGDFFHSGFDRARSVFPNAATAETSGDNFPATARPDEVAEAIATFIATCES
jgi:pimeloyl-ACP methyl ester carboxylesterase